MIRMNGSTEEKEEEEEEEEGGDEMRGDVTLQMEEVDPLDLVECDPSCAHEHTHTHTSKGRLLWALVSLTLTVSPKTHLLPVEFHRWLHASVLQLNLKGAVDNPIAPLLGKIRLCAPSLVRLCAWTGALVF